ncbi:MAG: cell division protein ZipA C-terminal FtsZ-binding domain-containing protein [Thiohalocapsa sp.]
MDAATLRLILIVVGVAFLIGLYLWERRRAEGPDREQDWENYLGDKREPNLGPVDSDESPEEPWEDFESSSRSEAKFAQTASTADARPGADDFDAQARDSVTVTSDEMADDSSGVGARPGQQSEFETGADESASPSGPMDSREPLLIQLFVVTRGEPFAGERILAAAGRLKLTPGSMDIFHRQASEESVRGPLYSMANLVKPGSFPFHHMDSFETQGLALFAQFDGDPSDLMVFDELLHGARDLADVLDGEVQAKGRQPLTNDRARALRGQVSALLQRQSDQTASE